MLKEATVRCDSCQAVFSGQWPDIKNGRPVRYFVDRACGEQPSPELVASLLKHHKETQDKDPQTPDDNRHGHVAYVVTFAEGEEGTLWVSKYCLEYLRAK